MAKQNKQNDDMVSVTVIAEHKGINGDVKIGDSYVTDSGHASVLVEAGYVTLTNETDAKL